MHLVLLPSQKRKVAEKDKACGQVRLAIRKNRTMILKRDHRPVFMCSYDFLYVRVFAEVGCFFGFCTVNVRETALLRTSKR